MPAIDPEDLCEHGRNKHTCIDCEDPDEPRGLFDDEADDEDYTEYPD